MDLIDHLLEEAEKRMPPELQNAATWLISNIGIVDELLKSSFMTEESRQNCIEYAKREKEYILWILLVYQKLSQEHPMNPQLSK